MKHIVVAGFAVLLLSAGTAFADDIEGRWRTQSGATAQIATCGSGAFCITLRDGKFKGKQIGQMSSTGKGSYSGKITDPESNKTYSGGATITGDSLTMKGCVLGGLLCKGQQWDRL